MSRLIRAVPSKSRLSVTTELSPRLMQGEPCCKCQSTLVVESFAPAVRDGLTKSGGLNVFNTILFSPVYPSSIAELLQTILLPFKLSVTPFRSLPHTMQFRSVVETPPFTPAPSPMEVLRTTVVLNTVPEPYRPPPWFPEVLFDNRQLDTTELFETTPPPLPLDVLLKTRHLETVEFVFAYTPPPEPAALRVISHSDTTHDEPTYTPPPEPELWFPVNLLPVIRQFPPK